MIPHINTAAGFYQGT